MAEVGGWRFVGRQQGLKNRATTAERTGAAKSVYRQPLIGTCYLHTLIDDHSRIASVEAREDETKDTAVEVLRNAVAWFAARGVTVERVLTDNDWMLPVPPVARYLHHTGHHPHTHKTVSSQTNGKIERFHPTLAKGWAFKKFYPSKADRHAALPGWIHTHNHHRPHSAIGKQPPITRLNNLPGQYT